MFYARCITSIHGISVKVSSEGLNNNFSGGSNLVTPGITLQCVNHSATDPLYDNKTCFSNNYNPQYTYFCIKDTPGIFTKYLSQIQHQEKVITELTANLTTLIPASIKATEQEKVIAELTANLTETNRKLAETTKSLSAQGLGSTYVRWGRSTCPMNGTDLVYKGFAGGGLYTDTGAAADYICLSGDPLWGHYDDNKQQWSAKLYGTEYDFANEGTDFFGQHMYDHDVPCAVCRSTRSTSIMIPGRNQCYPGWTMEYFGYLVGGYPGHPAASNYACLDSRPETEQGDVRDDNGKIMYLVEGVCGSLRCPPYIENREITCVVCSL